MSVEQVILSRGSTRLFRRQTAAAPLLTWGLSAASRAVPVDAAPTGTLLEHLVNVHDVADAEAGGYRYTATDGFEGHTRSDDPRAAGAHLCLDQPLGGDSAYTVFHAATLDPLLDALGGRGYRAAQLEAGIVAGRLALNAVALADGATGLTFYDGLVSRYFHSNAAPLLATAVGIPDTTPAPSGTRANRPSCPATVALWRASPQGSTAHRPAIIHSKPDTSPRLNGAFLTTPPAAMHLRFQPATAAESLQRTQHLREVLDHRTEITSIRELVRPASQFATDDQEHIELSLDEALAMVSAGTIDDGKTVILLQGAALQRTAAAR